MSDRLRALRFFALIYGLAAVAFALFGLGCVALSGDYADWWQPIVVSAGLWLIATGGAFCLNEILERFS